MEIPSEIEASSEPTATAQLMAVETARRKIEEELKAAKAAAEEVKATAAAASEANRQIAAALADAQAKLADLTAAAVAAKTKITDDQAVIATKSDHIQKAQEHADQVRANLDRALTAATQQVTAAEAEKSKAEAAAEAADELLTKTKSVKASVETDVAAIAIARKTAEESATVSKGLADRSSEVETHLAAYEKRLEELKDQSAQQLKTIVDLLPGATTAGLAHSFNARRQTFLKPHNRWQYVFIGSLVALIGVALHGLFHIYSLQTPPTYGEVFRLWLARFPVAGALIWLALYASRESALAKRLEEDYGFKAAVASCFEGFKKQMAEFGKDAAPDSPLAKLLDNTLTTIAAPPGRIYDKHELTVSPTAEVKALVEATVTAAINATKAGPK